MKDWTLEDLNVCEYRDKNHVAIFVKDTGQVMAIYSREGPAQLVVRMVEASISGYFPGRKEMPSWPVESSIAVKILECMIQRDSAA